MEILFCPIPPPQNKLNLLEIGLNLLQVQLPNLLSWRIIFFWQETIAKSTHKFCFLLLLLLLGCFCLLEETPLSVRNTPLTLPPTIIIFHLFSLPEVFLPVSLFIHFEAYPFLHSLESHPFYLLHTLSQLVILLGDCFICYLQKRNWFLPGLTKTAILIYIDELNMYNQKSVGVIDVAVCQGTATSGRSMRHWRSTWRRKGRGYGKSRPKWSQCLWEHVGLTFKLGGDSNRFQDQHQNSLSRRVQC